MRRMKKSRKHKISKQKGGDGLTVGQLREALNGVADETPVYHVEFGGLTRSTSASLDTDVNNNNDERERFVIE